MIDHTAIDPAGLARLQRIGGPLFVARMIELFLNEAPERLASLRSGEGTGDLVAVGDAAHALKASAQNFGASRLARIAEQIELQIRTNTCKDLPTLIGELESAYDTVRVWLEGERETLKT